MQVTCFGFDWDAALKRPNAAVVVKEIIANDDIDLYTHILPDGIWQSDSAALHFEVADALATLRDSVEPAWRTAVGAVAGLVSSGDSIDELGLAALTDGCYFVSVSPERVKALHEAFGRLDRRALATLYGRGNIATPAEAEFLSYLDQWRAAVRFAQERGLGLIGHCG